MSYARFSDESDVYLFMCVCGELDCCGCKLQAGKVSFASTEGMLEHLAEHRAAGHLVPGTVDQELRDDDADNFPPSGGA